MEASASVSDLPSGALPIASTPVLVDPLAPGQPEYVRDVKQPEVSKLPVFFSSSYWFGSSFARTCPTCAVKHVGVAVGGGRVYVASGAQRRVYLFDAVTRAPDPSVASFDPGLSSVDSIAYYTSAASGPEVYVLGADGGGADVVKVFDALGGLHRTLSVEQPQLPKFSGLDVAWGELWLTHPGGGTGADASGQDAFVYDAQTGALKGTSRQPLDAIRPDSNPARSWWDISILPEDSAAFVDRRAFTRGPTLPGIGLPGSALCTGAVVQGCTASEQRGTDAVWGMHWFMQLASYAPGGYRPVEEFSVDQRGISTTLAGQPIAINEPGYYLTPKRTWVTQQQLAGDPDSLSDLVYNNREVRIDWDGDLTTSRWLRIDKCLRYVVSDADIYVVGDKGEHWLEQARDFQQIQLLVDGHVQQTSTSAYGQFCIDTRSLSDAPDVTHSPHQIKLVATVANKQVTIQNDNLHVDNSPPDSTMLPTNPWVRGDLDVRGTLTDAYSGPKDWHLDAQDSNGGTRNLCDGSANPSTTWTCTWHTGNFADGHYQLLFGANDQSSDGGNTVTMPPRAIGVDNTAPTMSLSGEVTDLASHHASVPNGYSATLHIDTSDAGSGMGSIEVDVDGAPRATFSQPCDEGCSLSRDFAVDGGAYSDGDHDIRVVGQDAVGNRVEQHVGVVTEAAPPAQNPDADPGPEGAASANAPVTTGSSKAALAPEVPGADPVKLVDDLMPCTTESKPVNFPYYSLGPSFEGMPVTDVLRACAPPYPGEILRLNMVSYVYGDCDLPTNEDAPSCQPPIEIQTFPACERNIALYTDGLLPIPHEDTVVRGVPSAWFDNRGRLEVYTGVSTVVIFGTNTDQILRAAEAMQLEPPTQLPTAPLPALAVRNDLDQPATGAMDDQLPCVPTTETNP